MNCEFKFSTMAKASERDLGVFCFYGLVFLRWHGLEISQYANYASTDKNNVESGPEKIYFE